MQGRREKTEERKILAIMVVKQVQNSVVNSTYAGSVKQPTERWKRISSQRVLILKLHWCWFIFFILLHWNPSITKLWVTTCAQVGRLPALPHSITDRQQGIPGKIKNKVKSSRCAFKFRGISKFHWMTESSKTPVEDTRNLAISLSAEDRVSFKWLHNIQVYYFVQRH